MLSISFCVLGYRMRLEQAGARCRLRLSSLFGYCQYQGLSKQRHMYSYSRFRGGVQGSPISGKPSCHRKFEFTSLGYGYRIGLVGRVVVVLLYHCVHPFSPFLNGKKKGGGGKII